MPSKIKTSDFVENSGDIQKLIDELKELRVELQKASEEQIKSAELLQKANSKLSAARKSDREEIEQGAKAAEEIAKRTKIYSESLDENAKKIAALKNAQRTLNQVNKLEAKLLTAKKGSYDQLSAQYSLNKIRLNQMSKEERKATKEGQKLVKVTNDIYQEMKQLQEETGKHTLSVGDYAKANEGLIEKLQDMPGALGGAGDGLTSLNKKFKILSRNPFIFLLSIVVSGLIALGTAFKSSEKGARLFEKAGATISALFSNLVELSVSVAENIEFAFNNPLEAVKGLGSAIITNVINRFKALGIIAVEIGKAIGESLTLNFEEAEAAIKRAGEAVVQLGTGLDSNQQKAFTDAVKETVKEINNEVAAFQKLAAARISINRSNRALTKSVEELTTKEALLRTFADDTTRSFKEREKAAEDARKALESKSSKEIQIAKNNLSLINQEIDLRRRNGENIETLLDSQLSSYSALKQAEREYTIAVRDNERTRDELKQDRLERDLDILLDIFDNQKTINEKLIADDELTFEKRKSILDQTNSLNDSSFAKQIETIQKFTGIAIDSNELIGESDAIVLNQKIRSLGLSEIIEGRLIEIIRDRKSANQDLAESERELNKAIKKSAEDQLKFRKSLIDKAKKAYEDFQTARKEGTIRTFEQQQELAKSEFDLLKTTEEEKTRFALNAEKERIQKIIEINKQFGGDLSDIQIQTFKNQIEKLNQEIEAIGKSGGVKDIYDLFGFKLGDEQKEGINSGLAFAKQQLLDFAATRTNIANQNVEAANTEIATAQRQLDIEISNNQAGLASNVDRAKKELAAAKDIQKEALEEQRKAQRAEAAIQTIQQASNLITASAKIFKQIGNPFIAIPLIALMFGSFAASKIKANQLAKKTLGDGGLEIVGGGSHASGDDTYLGFQSEGKPVYAERGEAHMVIPTKRTRQYKSVLPKIFDSLRNGTFEKNYTSINGSHTSGQSDVYIQSSSSNGLTDVSKMENSLEAIQKNSEVNHSVNADGQNVIRYKNLTQTYV